MGHICITKSLHPTVCLYAQLLGLLDMSVPVVAKFRRLLDSLPRETLPDVVASMIRTSNKEKLQVGRQHNYICVNERAFRAP